MEPNTFANANRRINQVMGSLWWRQSSKHLLKSKLRAADLRSPCGWQSALTPDQPSVNDKAQ